MSYTIFKGVNRTGDSLSGFIVNCLGPKRARIITTGFPMLTPETCRRLGVTIPTELLTNQAVDLLEKAGQEPPRDGPLETFVAPAVRTVGEFRNCGGVALATLRGWRVFTDPQFDEIGNQISVVVDDLTTVSKDPRDPSVVPFDAWTQLHERPHPGNGFADRPYEILKAAVRLSEFSVSPNVPVVNITGVVRHFITDYPKYTEIKNGLVD